VNPHSKDVHHFNRFAFRHQFEQLPAVVSCVVGVFRLSRSNLAARFRTLARVCFLNVTQFAQFPFRHHLTPIGGRLPSSSLHIIMLARLSSESLKPCEAKSSSGATFGHFAFVHLLGHRFPISESYSALWVTAVVSISHFLGHYYATWSSISPSLLSSCGFAFRLVTSSHECIGSPPPGCAAVLQ
jgi:hypothetical protein